MKPKYKLKSPIDSIIIDMILDYFNIQSLTGRREILTSEKFDDICKHAEKIYFESLLINFISINAKIFQLILLLIHIRITHKNFEVIFFINID